MCDGWKPQARCTTASAPECISKTVDRLRTTQVHRMPVGFVERRSAIGQPTSKTDDVICARLRKPTKYGRADVARRSCHDDTYGDLLSLRPATHLLDGSLPPRRHGAQSMDTTALPAERFKRMGPRHC